MLAKKKECVPVFLTYWLSLVENCSVPVHQGRVADILVTNDPSKYRFCIFYSKYDTPAGTKLSCQNINFLSLVRYVNLCDMYRN